MTINERGDVALIHDGAIKVFNAEGSARTALAVGDEAPDAGGATFARL